MKIERFWVVLNARAQYFAFCVRECFFNRHFIEFEVIGKSTDAYVYIIHLYIMYIKQKKKNSGGLSDSISYHVKLLFREKRRRDDKPRQGRMGGWEEVGDKDDNEMDVDDDSEEASTRPKKNASSR